MTRNSKSHCSFSVYPADTYIESERGRGKQDTLFPAPSQSTVVTGILRGLHNNISLDMGFEEKEGTCDAEKRTYDSRWVGFVCGGHTVYSGDAGKSRRVCVFTRFCVLHVDILDCLSYISAGSGEADWIVYCMGYTCPASVESVSIRC